MPIPKDFASPTRLTAKERALQQIQRWIIEGVLLPGEKLVDAELAETLGVSRTPIREALQLLEAQGLVELHPGKETRVTRIDREDILKLYPTLAALHALAAEQAARTMLPEGVETLKAINAEFAQAVEEGAPFRAMECDETFHNAIVDAADNPYVTAFAASLQMHIRRFKYVYLKEKMTASSDSVTEHAAVIAAIEARDADGALAAMKRNILRPMQELYGFIQSSGDGQ